MVDQTKPNVVIYHGRCPDGFGAAFAAWLSLGESAAYLPYEHGAAPPDVTGQAVYILDFSFGPEEMARMEEQATRIVLLDHHDSAIADLAGYRCTCGRGRLGLKDLILKLDNSKSGARLAWEHFHPATPVPKLISFIEERDLWRWAGDENEIRAYLAHLDVEPYEFGRWKQLLSLTAAEEAEYQAVGTTLKAAFEQQVDNIADEAVIVDFCGHRIPMVQASRLYATDVGHRLVQRHGNFSLMWSIDTVGPLQVKVGLRSAADVTVLPLAQRFGGGGHPRACGFQLPLTDLPALLAGEIGRTA